MATVYPYTRYPYPVGSVRGPAPAGPQAAAAAAALEEEEEEEEDRPKAVPLPARSPGPNAAVILCVACAIIMAGSVGAFLVVQNRVDMATSTKSTTTTTTTTVPLRVPDTSNVSSAASVPAGGRALEDANGSSTTLEPLEVTEKVYVPLPPARGGG